MTSTDPQNRRPEPTRLVLLEQIRALQQGTKVRFLGCVHAYSGKRAFLVLKQDFPATTAKTPVVLANISHILESVNLNLVQIGAWVNIVGYVRSPVRTTIDEDVRRPRETITRRKRVVVPFLEVTMIWSAGAINLQDYELAARSYQTSHPKPT